MVFKNLIKKIKTFKNLNVRFERVNHWDKIFITPAISIVLDTSFTGYKYISLSFLRLSLDICWDYVNNNQ